MDPAALVSGFFGYVSIALWVVVLVPQIRLNYQRKSCHGVSLAFYALWTLGDLLNLVGASMESLIPTAILLPLYYIVTDAIVLAQFYIYRNRQPLGCEESGENRPLLDDCRPDDTEKPSAWLSWRKAIGIALLLALAGAAAAACLLPCPEWVAQVNPRKAIAQICGYSSAAVYLGAYVPQLLHNYRSKSTEGLSMSMFVIVMLANATFCLSILSAEPPTYDYLRRYASWLLGAAGTVWLELAILYQFYIYRPRHR
ncbi:putative vacuolar membrane transporter for cationic amino acids [Coemansia sp. RSA 552]|nr:putative vacuolar membrane transporter for cationic amino acids [Coemansia sp. RSA 552]